MSQFLIQMRKMLELGGIVFLTAVNIGTSQLRYSSCYSIARTARLVGVAAARQRFGTAKASHTSSAPLHCGYCCNLSVLGSAKLRQHANASIEVFANSSEAHRPH